MTTPSPPPSLGLLPPERAQELHCLIRELTPEQALWLSGYLAAAATSLPAVASSPTASAPHSAPDPASQFATAPSAGAARLTVLYGTETGNARSIAQALVRRAGEAGFEARALDLAEYRTRELRDESFLALVAATHGEGDPPDGAVGFFEFLAGRKAPRLDHARFTVLALGDSSYVEYCRAGRDLDERLEELGARRFLDRVDCDVDYEEPAEAWIERVVAAAGQEVAGDETGRKGAAGVPSPVDAPQGGNGQGAVAGNGASGSPSGAASVAAGILEIMLGSLPRGVAHTAGSPTGATLTAPPDAPRHSRRNPFPAELLDAGPLTGLRSDKETLHLELSVEGSGLQFEPGDSLGIVAANEDAVVEAVVNALGAAPGSPVWSGGEERPFSDALRQDLELTLLTPAFLSAYAELAAASQLAALLQGEDRSALLHFMRCHQVSDVLEAFPVPGLEPQRFADMLRRLQPRLYSIASSPRWSPGQVDLTVAVTRRTPDGKARNGVASTYVADRRRPGDRIDVFVDPNEDFRPPAEPDIPLIMIGAGTGVAPFRAFLQDREETGAGGRSWLFFGERRFREDFLYQTEWQRFLSDGVLSRMDVAFSRDQARKVYVQDRLQARGREVYAWMEEGAAVYVCGDATGMAPGVHEALASILVQEGGHSAEDAEARLRDMKSQGRYRRDVY
ncbi:MAG: flavodoxin domain-containing protein [Gemmatimonadota bacterium]